MELCIGFLQEVDPNLVQCTGSKLWFRQRFARNVVVDIDSLPLPIFAQAESIDSLFIDIFLIEKKSFDQSLIGQCQGRNHRVKGMIFQLSHD